MRWRMVVVSAASTLIPAAGMRRDSQSGDAAMWENPRDGFHAGCIGWSNLETCIWGQPGGSPDLMFALLGSGH